MNEERSFERFVADNVGGQQGGVPLPDDFYDDMHSLATTTRQRPEWLALIKEPPMRTNSHLAVGSPTVRVAAIMAATFLLILALAAVGAGAQRLLAADGPIVVDQGGDGTFTTIGEAVSAARDGGKILVRPGTYAESVSVVGKDLTITGDGDRNDIVISAATTGSPETFDLDPHFEGDAADVMWAVLFAETGSSLSGVTVMTPYDQEGILVIGADATADLDDIVVGSPHEVPGEINAVYWLDGASGSLRNSLVEGWVGLNADTNVVVEGNDMPATCLGVWEQGADVIIRNNVIHGCPFQKGIDVEADNRVVIEGNDIWVEDQGPGAFDGGRIGVSVFGLGDGPILIRDNDIRDSVAGVMVSGTVEVEFADNRIRDNETGIAQLTDDSLVTGNTVTNNGIGLNLARPTEVRLSGNTVCDNVTNVILPPSGDMSVLAGNEICEDD